MDPSPTKESPYGHNKKNSAVQLGQNQESLFPSKDRKLTIAMVKRIKIDPNIRNIFEESDDKAFSRMLSDVSPVSKTERFRKGFINEERSSLNPKEFVLEPKEELFEDNRKHDVSRNGSYGLCLPDSRRTFVSYDRSPINITRRNSQIKGSPNKTKSEIGNGKGSNSSSSSRKAATISRLSFISKFRLNQMIEENQDSPPQGRRTNRMNWENAENPHFRESQHVNTEHPINMRNISQINLPDPVVNENHERLSIRSEHNNQAENTEADNGQQPQASFRVYNDDLANLDACIHLRRACVTFSTVIICSLILISMMDNKESYRRLFIILYCFLGYLAIETLMRLRLPEAENWKKRERLFDFFEIIAFVLFGVCLDLYLSKMTIKVLLGFVPLSVAAVLYCMFSNAPRYKKDIKAFTKVLFACQALLIGVKLDLYMELEWKVAVMFLWIYFGLSAAYSLIITCLIIAMVFFAIFKVQQFTFSEIGVKVVGLFWYSLYHGSSVLVILGLVSVSDFYDETASLRLLHGTLKISLYLNSFLLVYTLMLFVPLKKFVKVFEMNNNMVSQGSLGMEEIQPVQSLTFQVEKTNNYFVMLSSTYFLPLKQGFLTKSKQKMQRMRSKLSSIKLDTLNGLGGPSNQPDTATTSLNKISIINELKKDKESLDRKLEAKSASLKQTSLKDLNARKIQSNNIEAAECGRYSLKVDENVRKLAAEILPQTYPNQKLFISVDGIEDIIDETMNQDSVKEDRSLCYICFERIPNAMLMNCGHGGICYECAVSMIQSKNECMECRKPVKVIYKVDFEKKVSGIVKSFEHSKVIEVKSNTPILI